MRRAFGGGGGDGGRTAALAQAALAAVEDSSCTVVSALLSLRLRGQPVYAASFAPLPLHATEEGTGHLFGSEHSGREVVSACSAVTAGDLFDWPTAFAATVYARRVADGAIACVARNQKGDIGGDESDDDDSSDDEKPAQSSFALRFNMAVGTTADVDDDGVSMELKLRFQSHDAAAPLFFLAPGFRTRRSNKPRPPLCWRAGPFFFSSGDWHGEAAIPEAALASRAAVSADEYGACAVLSFASEGADCSCDELCTALGVLRWEAP